jgi:hypothetical protein
MIFIRKPVPAFRDHARCRECPRARNLEPVSRKDRGVSAGKAVAVFGAAGRAWAAHVVQFRAVRTEDIAGHVAPEAGERGERAGQQRRCRTRNCQNGPTHVTRSARPGLPARLVPWSPQLASKFMRMSMPVQFLRSGQLTGLRAGYRTGFPKLYRVRPRGSRQPLPCSLAPAPLHQLRISRQKRPVALVSCAVSTRKTKGSR